MEAMFDQVRQALERLPETARQQLANRFLMEIELQELEEKEELNLHEMRRQTELQVALGFTYSLDETFQEIEAQGAGKADRRRGT